MKTSDSIIKIAPALLSAQKAIGFAAKDSKNPAFKSSYANLESVIEAIKAPLNDAGIMFMQTFAEGSPGFLSLTTRLLHTSGEWIEDTLTMPLTKHDAQGFGSAATYARRYALAAITGLYQADDDGTDACRPAPKPSPEPTLSQDQITSITDLAKESGVTIVDICKTGKVSSLSEIKCASYNSLKAWIESKKKVAE